MKIFIAHSLKALLFSSLLPICAMAQIEKSSPMGGNWFIARGGAGTEQMPELIRKMSPDVAFIRDTGSPRLNGGDFGDLQVTDAARAEALAWDPLASQTVSEVCRPPSIIYGMPGPFPIEIFPATELIVMKLEYYDMVRIIFMDGRPHPDADYPHTAVGHSVGHWEDDVLVVDTTHLHKATIYDNGLNHSENIHVIERFRLSDDGMFLHMTQEFDDPEVLRNRAGRYVVYAREPGQVNPYNCDPAYGLSIQGR
jgi:hypothetical protein